MLIALGGMLGSDRRSNILKPEGCDNLLAGRCIKLSRKSQLADILSGLGSGTMDNVNHVLRETL